MTTQRPSFRPITTPLDVDDEVLDRLNEKLGVPALVRSDPDRPASGQEPLQDSSKRVPRPSPSRNGENSPRVKKPALATPEPVEKLSIELPGYLTDALKRQAAENRTSVRYIVMRGLVAIGFDIAPADLVPDARRLARKSRKR